MRDNIILLGFMGVGKSTVGRRLAERLGFEFVETDALVEERAGLSIPDIFTRHGEPHFRDLEHEVVRGLLERHRAVIATGGGVVLRADNREALERAGMTVLLDAGIDELLARLDGRTGHRPLLAGEPTRERIAALVRHRRPFYAAARHCVATDGLGEDDVVEAILPLWHQYTALLEARGLAEDPTR